MENVGSPSAADDGTPVQPICSSTPPVPSFPAPLGTTGVPPVSPTETRKRGRPSPGMTTPSPSQVAGGGLSSPTQPQEDGASPGMTTPPPSQVAGGGLSCPTQPQADEAAVSTGSEAAALGFMQSHVIKIKAGEDILAKIMSFCESTSKAVCVLSANGSISNVSLCRPDEPGLYEILSLTGFFFVLESGGQRSREGCLTVILGNAADGDVWGGNVDGLFTAATDVQGLFQIINLSGFLFVLESGGECSTEGGLSVLLGGEADGYIRGGSVAGLLTAITAVQVIVGSFSTQKQRPLKSVGTLSESSGGPDSPPDETRKKRSYPGVKDQKPWK